MSERPTFTCPYRIGDREFTFTIHAENRDDAERHVHAIRHTAKLDGEIVAEGYLPTWLCAGGRQ